MSEATNLIQGQGTSADDWRASQRLAELPEVTLDELIAPGSRLLVVAPHPDDEVLACGGLLAQLIAQGMAIHVIAVTDGEGSHPGSTLWPPGKLRATRQQESQLAVGCLGAAAGQITWQRLHLADSRVAEREEYLFECLTASLGQYSHVITTWQLDGHCDHEAVGRATARAASSCAVQLYEMPIWAWHWAQPEDPRIPWQRACKLRLSDEVLARKQAAIHTHCSQLLADPSTGAEPILTERTLARFAQPYEVYFR